MVPPQSGINTSWSKLLHILGPVQFKLFINGLEEEMERMLIKLQVIENKIGYFRRQK